MILVLILAEPTELEVETDTAEAQEGKHINGDDNQ